MTANSKKNFVLDTLYIIIWCAIIIFVFRFLLGYLLPFAVSFLIAALLQRACSWLEEKTRLSFSVCAVICVLAFYLLAVGIICVLTVLAIKLTGSVYDELPEIFSAISATLESAYENIERSINVLPESLRNFLGASLGSLKGFMGDFVGGKLSSFAGEFAGKIPSFFLSLIITFIASFYFTKDYKKLISFFADILPKKIFVSAVKIKAILFENVFKIVLAYLILCGITFCELLILFFIMGIERAFMLSFIIALVDLLPVLGAGIILVPWGIIAIISGNTTLGIELLAIYIFLTVTRNIIEPKIVSKQTGIGPLLTLIAMFLGLKFLGFIGVILFPVALTVVFKFYKDA